MNPGFTLRALAWPLCGCATRIGMAVLATIAWSGCAAQERTGMQVAGTYPYAASVLAAPKSLRVENGPKNLNEPVMRTIAPDSSGPAAIAFPERRSAVDQML